MSKSNQESSPITQWRETVKSRLATVRDASALDANNGAEDWTLSDGVITGAFHDLTSATIELVEKLLPEKLDPSAFPPTHQFNSPAPFDETWNNGYNNCIDNLRQSLKELKGE